MIFKVAIPVPIYRVFDYLAPADIAVESLELGVRLEVPFGNAKKIA